MVATMGHQVAMVLVMVSSIDAICLQQYGLQEPAAGWSWEDFRTLAKQMTRGKMHGVQMQDYKFGEALTANQLASSAVSMGGIRDQPVAVIKLSLAS